jgi:hypothetical protein
METGKTYWGIWQIKERERERQREKGLEEIEKWHWWREENSVS